MKNSKLLLKMLFLSILSALFYSPAIFAGTITITPSDMNPGTVGTLYTVHFTATSTDPNDLNSANVVWQANATDLGRLHTYGLDFILGTQTVSGTPTIVTSPIDSIRIDFINTVTSAQKEYAFYYVINRRPIDLMIVLDKSGSMAYSFDGTNLSAPTGQRRWDGLVTGIGSMVSSLNNPANLFNADRIGLTYFESGVTPAGAPFTTSLVQMNSANLSALTSDVGNHGPGSNTALGDGILTGKGLLLPGTAGNRKAMIVFSDGVQNAGNLVVTTGADAFKKAGTTLLSSNTTDTVTYTINSICLGESGYNPTLMQGIADNNGHGSYFNSTANDMTAANIIQTFFLTTIQSILSGSSPEFVDVRNGLFKADSSGRRFSLLDSFTVNKSASSVFVVLAAANTLEPGIISVKKDGVELIQYVHSSNGPGYRSFYVNFPLPSLPAVKPDGQWVIRATGNSPVGAAAGGTALPAYTLSMTVEDRLNHLRFSLNSNLKVGDTLYPAVSVKRGLTPFGTATVQAFIVAPGDDINDLIARSDVKYTIVPGDSSSPNIYKLAELLKDSAFLARLKDSDRMVPLTYQPASQSYTGSFSPLNVAGVYRVIYRITNSDTNGVMNRFYLKSFNVRFKDVDLPASGVTVTIDSATNNAIIIFRPVSSTGKYIGSGWGPSIGLSASGLTIQKVEDLGDGSYKLHLSGPLAGNGTLTIANDTVYNGNLSDITKTGGHGGQIWKAWWFWVLLLLILLIIIRASRKKQP